jgi:hypothetical protein
MKDCLSKLSCLKAFVSGNQAPDMLVQVEEFRRDVPADIAPCKQAWCAKKHLCQGHTGTVSQNQLLTETRHSIQKSIQKRTAVPLPGEHFDAPQKEVRREQISSHQKIIILQVTCGTEFR